MPSRKRKMTSDGSTEHLDEAPLGGLELRDQNRFVRRVRARDIAWAKDDGIHSGGLEHRRFGPKVKRQRARRDGWKERFEEGELTRRKRRVRERELPAQGRGHERRELGLYAFDLGSR